MKKKIIIDGNFPTETRVVLLDKNNNIENIEFSSTNKRQIKGNIYLAKVTRVEPSLQAAFVDYGGEKSGFLPFSEIHPDYYQILSTDKNSSMVAGSAIDSPEITPADLKEKRSANKFHELIDSEDIDISKIEKIVSEKPQADINIAAREDDIDHDTKHSDTIDKQYKIQEAIKKGQILLVQATKEERGNKGASLTSYISLAGKYCVLMPNKASQNGISKKILNNGERNRLKKIIDGLAEKNKNTSSVIARTAGVGHTTLEIKKDYDYLARLWNKIREATLNSKAPCFIHQEDGIILKTIRDMYDRNVKEIIVQGEEAYKLCQKYMHDVLTNQVKVVKEYKNKVPIYTKYGIEDQLIKLYQPVVYLPSGGYIVINPTEALISIDVNSGKATSERNIEEMALKTNLEAAREIARQSRIRDLSGLLVLDFIDLHESKNRKILERSLWEFFSKDKARIQTAPISTFGLLEMSRQRLSPSFLEMNSSMCSHCSGKGIVRADGPNAMLILRTIENEIFSGKYDVVNVFSTTSSIIYLLNHKREEIALIESKYSIKLNFLIDKDATFDSYSIETIKLSDKEKSNTPIDSPVLQHTSEIYNEGEEKPNSQTKRKINRNKAALNSNKKAEAKVKEDSQNLEKKDKIQDNEKVAEKKEVKKKEASKNKKKIIRKPSNNTKNSVNQENQKTSNVKAEKKGKAS